MGMLGKSESVSTKYILLVYQAAVALLPAPDAATTTVNTVEFNRVCSIYGRPATGSIASRRSFGSNLGRFSASLYACSYTPTTGRPEAVNIICTG